MVATFLVLLLSGVVAARFQAQPPDTEIFLAPLTVVSGTLSVGTPVNITSSPGYDNQPSFTPDGAALLFTSGRGGVAAEGRAPQTDIYRYNISARRVARVTETPESEYSPTVTPDGARISVIRVETDGTQRVWRFTLDGRQPELVLADVKPVGYHAWADAETLVPFVLGQPPTLQIADTRTGRAVEVVKGVGRSIQRMPGGGVSFTQRDWTRVAALAELGLKGRDAARRQSAWRLACARCEQSLIRDQRLHCQDGSMTWRRIWA